MAGRAFRACSVRKGYAGNSEMLATAFFPAPFFERYLVVGFGVGLCMHSGFWEAVRRAIFSWQKTFPKMKSVRCC